MKICFSIKKNFLLFFAFLFTNESFSQTDSLPVNLPKQIRFNKGNFGIESTASILPPAKIINTGGNYTLKSQLQSSYDLGINYNRDINNKLTVVAGFHFIVGKWNLLLNVPPQDLGPNYTDGRRIIEFKELWGAIRLPLLVEHKIGDLKRNPLFIRSGLNLRYSGLMSDLDVSSSITDSNNQSTRLFSGSFEQRNNNKPWLTFLAGAGKSFTLKNNNKFSVCLQADISPVYFLKGNYEITIPQKPVSTGIYKVSGTSLGLSVQYIFTGANKQIIMPEKRKKNSNSTLAKTPFNRKEILEKYVFKGNHIQFNFARLSTFKARLKNESGNYAVNTKSARGSLLSFKYSINFNNEFSLITGAEAMLLGRNFIVSFAKNDFSPPLISDYNLTRKRSLIQELVLSLPIIAEKRWLYSKTKFLSANAGLRLNFSLGGDFDFSSFYLLNTANNYYNAGGVDVNANNDAKPWVSFPLTAGHGWLLRNNNLLELSIYSNISFTRYVNGTYQIDIPNKPLTNGRYSSTGSFVGLSLNYVFTNANYRIRKDYEKIKK